MAAINALLEGITKTAYRFSIAALVLLVPIIAVMAVFPNRILINETPSIPYRVMWLSKPSELRKGAYYTWTASSPYVHDGKPFLIVKKAVCVAGEFLTVKGRDYFCGPFLIGVAKDKSLTGDPVRPYTYNGAIPAGQFFSIGHHLREEKGKLVDDSFDSRYFGLVDFSKVRSEATPLL